MVLLGRSSTNSIDSETWRVISKQITLRQYRSALDTRKHPVHLTNEIVGVQSRNKCSLGNVERKESKRTSDQFICSNSNVYLCIAMSI
jgi:hypothetical protein